jgi:hypothetical protein
MSFRSLLAPIVVIGAFSTPALAQERGPSTAEERDRVVKLALESEKDPLGALAKEERWFEKWLEAVPDILFGPEAPARWCESAAKGDLRKALRFQYSVSAVAYQIQHKIFEPKTMEEKLAIHQAALEGVLHAYETLLPKRPENRSDKMEEALALRAKGELPAFVKSLFAGKR